MKNILKNINWSKENDLVPAIIQNAPTNRVLMLGYMNKEALQKTIATKRVWFYSRSKQRLWMKGEESKNYLEFIAAKLDCDNDTLLITANQLGPTCHRLTSSCFDSTKYSPSVNNSLGFVLDELVAVIKNRQKKLPAKSYTASLFEAGLPKICAKITEEAGEVVVAALSETKNRLISESADLIYHFIVLLIQKNINLSDIARELNQRKK